MATKVCKDCGEEKDIEKFEKRYLKHAPNSRKTRCRTCDDKRPNRKASFNRKRAGNVSEIKLKAIEFLGGKCMGKNCPLPPDYQVPPCCFDFHHRDPAVKDANIHRLIKQSWAAVLRELSKCDLLCCLCHRMIHAENACEVIQV